MNKQHRQIKVYLKKGGYYLFKNYREFIYWARWKKPYEFSNTNVDFNRKEVEITYYENNRFYSYIRHDPINYIVVDGYNRILYKDIYLRDVEKLDKEIREKWEKSAVRRRKRWNQSKRLPIFRYDPISNCGTSYFQKGEFRGYYRYPHTVKTIRQWYSLEESRKELKEEYPLAKICARKHSGRDLPSAWWEEKQYARRSKGWKRTKKQKQWMKKGKTVKSHKGHYYTVLPTVDKNTSEVYI